MKVRYAPGAICIATLAPQHVRFEVDAPAHHIARLLATNTTYLQTPGTDDQPGVTVQFADGFTVVELRNAISGGAAQTPQITEDFVTRELVTDAVSYLGLIEFYSVEYIDDNAIDPYLAAVQKYYKEHLMHYFHHDYAPKMARSCIELFVTETTLVEKFVKDQSNWVYGDTFFKRCPRSPPCPTQDHCRCKYLPSPHTFLCIQCGHIANCMLMALKYPLYQTHIPRR